MKNQETILVVGGAGYVGSHMVDMLIQENYRVVVLDNLSYGHEDAIGAAEFVLGDINDSQILDKIFSKYNVIAVMHFASFILVGQSFQDPLPCYRNNVDGTMNVVNAMVRHKVKNFILSSSAAVYGKPEYTPVDEAHPKNPDDPYGCSKWIVERILQDYQSAYDFNSISLRFFNAAGAHPKGILAERHEPEVHLIPLVLQAASGERECISIFGEDYDTPDGTCIRDYVHVTDICQAHLLALRALLAGKPSGSYNLGTQHGYSVREVIEMARKVTGKEIVVKMAARRRGDPVKLVADATLAKKELGWKPEFSDLRTIVTHAWQAHLVQHEKLEKV